MIRVLKNVLGKVVFADPDEYKARVKNLERTQQQKEGLKRVGSSSSFGTMYSKSQKTGLTGGSSFDGGESTHGMTEKDIDYSQSGSNFTKKIENDPIFM